MSGGYVIGRGLGNPTSLGANFAQYGEPGTAITAPTAQYTKGAWFELTTSATGLPTDAAFMRIFLYGTTNGGSSTSFAVDVGIGASGSQIVLIPNLVVYSNSGYNTTFASLLIPVTIPQGSHIWARYASSAASGWSSMNSNIAITTFDGGFDALEGAGVDAIGFNSATNLGTPVTPLFGSKGSWSSIGSPTTRDYVGCFCLLDGQNLGGLASDTDIAIGTSGSQEIILPDLVAYSGIVFQESTFFETEIPTGSQLWACSANFSGPSPTNIGVTVYGVYQ